MTAPALAGCLQGDDLEGQGLADDALGSTSPAVTGLSEPVYDVLPLRSVDVTSFDGTPLNGYLALPDHPALETGENASDANLPVIINYSPYFSNLAPPAREGGDAFSRWLVDHFVPRGYAVVIQSVRGTGESGGCFEMGGAREVQDMHATVTFYGEQPWSNGNVSLIGKSYDGTTANAAAIAAPPHLKTIVPIAAISDWYDYLYKDGVPYDYGIKQGHTFNARYALTVDAGVSSFGGGEIREENVRRLHETLCPELAHASAAGLLTGTTGDKSPYWLERNYKDRVGRVNASVFLVHGLQDWNVKPDHVPDWFDALDVPKKAWLGQWDHVYPTRADWDTTLLAWFDRWLKGQATGVMEGPTVLVEDSLGRWRGEATWPPDRAEPTELHLLPPQAGADVGSLGGTPPTESSTVSWQDDPLLEPAPPEPAPHFVAFATDPLGSELQVSGVPEITLHASVDRPTTHLVAVLYDVAPDGTWKPVDRGFLDARHRTGLQESTPLEPGRVHRFDLQLYPTDTVFLPGHRVGLALASSYPMWVSDDGALARVSLQLGPGAPATLTLPTLPSVSLEEPQPTMLLPDEVPGNVEG